MNSNSQPWEISNEREDGFATSVGNGGRRAILSAPGSRGDVHPMLAIGQALANRGYDVAISVAEPYADLVRSVGLHANVVIDTLRFNELLEDRHVWKPIRGARRIFAWAANEFAPRHLRFIEDHFVAGETVLVSHPLDFASRIYREFNDVSLTDIHLAPSMLRTYEDPPQMTGSLFECRRPAWLVRWAYRMMDRWVVDPVVFDGINRLRQQTADSCGQLIGSVAPVRRIIDQWWLSPDRVLAMYPSWFAPAISPAFAQVTHCGFPLRDQFGPAVNETAIDDTTASHKFDATSREIVFTSGTAHRHGAEFFASAVAACEKLGRRGLLLSKHPGNVPQSLPDSVRTLEYQPLSKILPGAAAVVHHGGIGTTAAAIAAGCPQIICPMAFDQFDNARHVERLGVGKSIRDSRSMAKALACLLDDRSYRLAAARLAEKQNADGDAIDRAANIIHNSFSATTDS